MRKGSINFGGQGLPVAINWDSTSETNEFWITSETKDNIWWQKDTVAATWLIWPRGIEDHRFSDILKEWNSEHCLWHLHDVGFKKSPHSSQNKMSSMIVLYTWYFCFLISVSTNILQHIYCILWFLLPLLLRKGWGLVEENLVLLCKKLVQIRPHPVLIQRMASLRLTFLTNSLVTREKLDLFEMIVKEAQQDPGRVAWLWKRYCFVCRPQEDPN